MANKKTTSLLLVSSFASVIAVTLASFNSNSSLNLVATANSCYWNHYDAVESTMYQSGSKEFWMCCNHHEIEISEPNEGVLGAHKGAPDSEFVNSLSTVDPRYEPKKGARNFIRIDPNGMSDSSGGNPLRATQSYSQITSVEFDVRAVGSVLENYTGWWGFSVVADPSQSDVYNCYNASLIKQTVFGGGWRHMKMTFSGATGYLVWGAAIGEFNPGTFFDFTNIEIHHSGGVSKESFDNGGSVVRPGDNKGHYLMAEEPSDIISIYPKLQKESNGCMPLKSSRIFEGVQSLTFRYRASSTTQKGSWGGFAFSSNAANESIYDIASKLGSQNFYSKAIFDGDWHSLTIPMNGATGYLVFAAEISSKNTLDDVFEFQDFKVVDSNYRATNLKISDFAPSALNQSMVIRSTVSKNGYVEIDPTKYSSLTGKVNLITNKKLLGIKNVTFDYRITSKPLDGKGWWGFGHSESVSGSSIYNGIMNVAASETRYYEDDWTTVTVGSDSFDGYLYFVCAVGEFPDGRIQIDNIKVNGVLIEDFNTTCTSFSMDSSVLGDAVSLKYESASGDTGPMFAKTKTFGIRAYAGPNNGVLLPDGKTSMTAEHVSKAADAGFTDIIGLFDGYREPNTEFSLVENLQNTAAKANSDAMKACELTSAYGMTYTARDNNLYEWTKSPTETSDETVTYYYDSGIRTASDFAQYIPYVLNDQTPYIHASGFRGNFLCDEPLTSGQMQRVGYSVDAYLDRMAELGVSDVDPFVNLLPKHCFPTRGLTYDQYLDSYVQNIGTKLGYISTDFYPYLEEGLSSEYLSHIEAVANKCTANGLDHHGFILASGHSGYRNIVSTQDFLFQMYTNMAFGVSSLSYFTYATRGDAYQDSLLDLTTGEYTSLYGCAQKANEVIHNMEDAFLSYTYDKVTTRGSDDNFNKLSTRVSNVDNVSVLSNSKPTLLTSFKHKTNGSDAYMLVNFGDPTVSGYNKVSLSFDERYDRLLQYKDGKRIVSELDESGNAEFTLKPGEGRFLIPFHS